MPEFDYMRQFGLPLDWGGGGGGGRGRKVWVGVWVYLGRGHLKPVSVSAFCGCVTGGEEEEEEGEEGGRERKHEVW